MSASVPEAPARMLSVGEVAARFKVSPLTIRRWTRRGDFPTPRKPAGPRGRLYFHAAEVEAYEAGRSAES